MIKELVSRPLLSPMAQADCIPAWRALGDDIQEGAWWGVPVWQIHEWITDALRKGDYQAASAYSAIIRTA
jgi:hypothetical protein